MPDIPFVRPDLGARGSVPQVLPELDAITPEIPAIASNFASVPSYLAAIAPDLAPGSLRAYNSCAQKNQTAEEQSRYDFLPLHLLSLRFAGIMDSSYKTRMLKEKFLGRGHIYFSAKRNFFRNSVFVKLAAFSGDMIGA